LPHLTLPLSLPALVVSAFLVSLATVAVPGPITLVATRLALNRNLAAAIWFLAGTTLLDVALFCALAAGAAPSLRRIGALPLVEIVGGMALVWGGIASFRSPPRHRESSRIYTSVEGNGALRSFLLGLLVSAGNPHYWIWWATAGLAFVEAARAHGESGLLWMLGALVGGVVTWYVPLLWALSRGSALLTPRAERIVTRGMGVVLLLLGLGLTGLGGWRLYAAHFPR
jgi:threonine/homoserine/homoserine lactone efflux protein